MPIVLNQQQSEAALASGSSELKHLLAREGVSANIRAVFYYVGATTLAKFAVLCRDENDVRKVMKDELGIDDQAGLAERGQIAGVLAAWNDARTRATEAAKVQGEFDAKRMTKPLLGNEYSSMRRAFEAVYGKIED